MNRYIIQYYSRTRVALAKRREQQKGTLHQWVFNFPNLHNYELTIALGDKIKKTDSVRLHTGLNIFADIKAVSENEARDVSKNFVEALLNFMSFATLAYCNSAKLVSIINIRDEESHPFKCYVYPFEEQEILGSLINIDESTFGTIFEAYNKSSFKPRILRALSWLRKGFGEEYPVDEFTSYWVGLEVIKHLLVPEKTTHWMILEAIKHIFISRRVKRKKRSIEEEWEEVEEIFQKRLNRRDFRKIKQAGRNGLLHGFRELDDKFMGEIESYVEPIRKILIYCIGSALGLENNISLNIANKIPRRIERDPWSVIKGNLTDLPREFSELVSSYPRLDEEAVNKQFSIDQEGKLEVEFKLKHHFHGPSGTKWELVEIEHWGKKGAGIQQITSGEFDVHKAKKLSSD